MCKTTGEVEHYYNQYMNPLWLNSSEKAVGISNATVQQINGWLICSFKRLKSNNHVINYIDLSERKYYILAANGELKQELGWLANARV